MTAEDRKGAQPPATPHDRGAPASPAAAATRVVSSDELFAGARELAIEHSGRRYQLRITQSGKLILTA